MFKLFVLSALLSVVYSQSCPFPFTNSINGYTTNYCYYYRGVAKSYSEAALVCQQFGGLVTIKDQAGLDDLYNLYKAYPDYYFWIGATSGSTTPSNFFWQDGTAASPQVWCSGHPKGGSNQCSFYTTTAIFGRDKCIESGPCTSSVFDHGAICQYGVNSFPASTTTTRFSSTVFPTFTTFTSFNPITTTRFGKKK